jgi:hypothetical protein
MNHSVVIRLGAAGRVIRLPGAASLAANSEQGRIASRLIREALDARRLANTEGASVSAPSRQEVTA